VIIFETPKNLDRIMVKTQKQGKKRFYP